MKPDLLLLVITVLVALTFDFLNGFHDAANSIATVVSTRVLSPKLAVVWAAFFNFVAAFLLGTAVAKTIGSGMIHIEVVTQYVVIAGLFGAIVWDILTWLWGLPTSSSHALIGGMAGAAIMRAGWSVIIPAGWYKTLIFIVVAPVMGLVLGSPSWSPSPGSCATNLRAASMPGSANCNSSLPPPTASAMAATTHRKPWASSPARSTAQKSSPPPNSHGSWGHYHWPIILAAHTAIALGTYFGGWRIVHTMGSRITKLKPVGGFCAETAGAITLFATALAGIPVSTTHTITGAIVGVGATHRLSAVRWGVATRIVWAWVFTIPAAALVSALAFYIIQRIHPGA